MWVHRKALRLGKRERFISSGRLFFIADPNRVIGHRCKFIIHARPRNRDNIFFRNEVDLIILFDWPFPFVVSISAICRVNWAKRDCRGCWKKRFSTLFNRSKSFYWEVTSRTSIGTIYPRLQSEKSLPFKVDAKLFTQIDFSHSSSWLNLCHDKGKNVENDFSHNPVWNWSET